MGTTPFTSTELVPVPKVDGGSIAVPECPVIPRRLPWTKKQLAFPLIVVVLFAAFVAMIWASHASPMMMVFPLGMAGMFMWMFTQQRTQTNDKTPSSAQLMEIRRAALVALDAVREEITASARQQFDRDIFLHPPSRVLGWLAGTPRMWERSANSEAHARHFGEIRVGEDSTHKREKELLPFGSPVVQGGPSRVVGVVEVNPSDDPAEHDPVVLDALSRFQLEQTFIGGMPGTISLQSTQLLNLQGEPERVYGLASAMALQAATFHSPHDLKIMIVTADPEQWDWAKWLPHVCDGARMGMGYDLGGQRRLVWDSAAAMVTVVDAELRTRPTYTPGVAQQRPHWLVFNDTGIDDAWRDLIRGGKGVSGCTFVQLEKTA